jgi:hypothetical protein
MVLVTYEIVYPCTSSDPALLHPPSTGALEMEPSEGGKLRMRDVAAQWPFAGRFHWRALYAPAAEPHVFLDLPDMSMPLPVGADGCVQLRALPLDFLLGVPRVAEALGEAELSAWRASRAAGAGAAPLDGASPAPSPRSAASSPGAEGGGSGGGGGGGGGGGSDAPWGHVEGGDFQEGGPGVGAGRGTLAEAAEEGLASAAAAAAAAGEAAGAALSAAKKMFSGWGASLAGALGKKAEGGAEQL